MTSQWYTPPPDEIASPQEPVDVAAPLRPTPVDDAGEAPLRLLVYDTTDRGCHCRRCQCKCCLRMPGLSTIWWLGVFLYQCLGRIDHAVGVSTWEDAFVWLANIEPGRRIGEIQFWGHGSPGAFYCRHAALFADHFVEGSYYFQQSPAAQQAAIRTLKTRMRPDSLFWLRTCSSFRGADGHRFAVTMGTALACRVAGHTYNIWAAQSGLHSLRLGETPSWSCEEGVGEGGASLWSGIRAPHNISFLTGKIPDGW